MPSRIDSPEISRRQFFSLMAAAGAAVFFGGHAHAQDDGVEPNRTIVRIPRIENGASPIDEQIETQLLDTFRKKMDALTGAFSPDMPLVQIVSPAGEAETFDGRKELLEAFPDMIAVITDMIHQFNDLCHRYGCKPWEGWRGFQNSISLQLQEFSSGAGASTYADAEHKHQQIAAEHGSIWEMMRFLCEVLVADANLEDNGFKNSDPVREAVVRSVTNRAMQVYLDKCMLLLSAGINFPIMKIKTDGFLTTPTRDQYVNFLQDELLKHQQDQAEPLPFGEVLPEQIFFEEGGVRADYGVSPLYQSTLGNLDQKSELFEHYTQIITGIVTDEVARWEDAGNSFGDVRAVFEMRYQIFFQGDDSSEYDALDSAMGWLDLTRAIRARLQSAGFALETSRYDQERVTVLSLTEKKPPMLQFLLFGNVGEGLDLHISQLSRVHSEDDMHWVLPATLRVEQNKIEGELAPHHYPYLRILYYVQSPSTNAWMWVEGSIRNVVMVEHGRCLVTFNDFVEFTDDTGRPSRVDLADTSVLAMIQMQQRDPMGGPMVKDTIFQQVAQFGPKVTGDSNTSSDIAFQMEHPSVSGSTPIDPATLPVFDEALLKRAEAGQL